jgi:flagellin
MSLVVNSNIQSLNTQRQLFVSSNKLSVAFEQLSSGFRINRAADDAAGLQISERLTSQIQGLNQAVRNANDGISLAQTAEGALTETTANLQRIRQLAVQAQNGINSPSDKQALNKEAVQLLNEINRIAQQTEFGGQLILDGTFSTQFLVGANSGQSIDVGLTQFSRGFGIAGLGVQGLDIATGSLGTSISSSDVSTVAAFDPNELIYEFETINKLTVSGTYKFAVSNDGGATFTQISANLLAGFQNGVANNAAVSNAVNSALGEQVLRAGQVRLDGAQPNFLFAVDTNNPSSLPMSAVGGASGTIGSYDSSLLDEGSEALVSIDGALSRVNGVRADLGATQNRFQSTIRNLSNISENISSARSQIRDTDYAAATAELTRQQIIQQASTTVLGQANQQPQVALSLLG